MSIKIDIFDGSESVLENILKLSYGTALESLSVAGSHLRDSARASMKSKSQNWFTVFSDGKKGKYITRRRNQSRELGLRISSKDGKAENPSSMASFITSYVMERSLTVVVGGMHPTFSPVIYKNGVKDGHLSPVGAVSKSSHAIIHKLNFGEINDEHKRLSTDLWKEGANYRGYHFMEEGWTNARGAIHDSLTKRYAGLLGLAVDRANVTVKLRKVV